MKKRRFNLLLAVMSLAVLASLPLQLHYFTRGPFSTRLLLLLFLNITILAALVLILFVVKSLVNLYFERKNKVPGHKFKTKLVVILVVLTLIPAMSLFIISSGFISNYIDRWFSQQIKQPMESSIEIAKAVYQFEKEKALHYAKTLPPEGAVPEGYTVRRLSAMPRDGTETLKAGFDGREGTEIISDGRREIVRAVVPVVSEDFTGIVVVEAVIPPKIAHNAEMIRDAYENYLTLESWKVPITFNYLMILGFITLLVAFMALWVALRISRGITDPIQNLAQATETVASGDLNVSVPRADRQDEIGLLIDSFNHMIRELRDKEESLHYAYLESDRRRLFMQNILDNINSGVIMLDKTGKILMINKRACSVINIPPEAIMNRNYRELMSMINSDDLRDLVGGIEGREFRPIKKEIKVVIGNRKIILWVFITSLRDAQDYVGLLVVFDDLTEVIEAQKALTWQDVARKIAHEIKNPLTPIRLSTERMLKKWEQKDQDFDAVFRRSTRTIVKEVDSLKKLVDEFSKFGRMPEIKRTPTSLPAVINEAIDLYEDCKGVEIAVSVPPDMPPAEVDPEQIKRVMINLFDNALQAMKDGGKIEVNVDFAEPFTNICITVADNGPGIPEADKEKLFLPYFSTRKNGSGLGLAIASRIVKEHGGTITVRDNEPRGTLFSIEIPAKET